MKRLVFWAAGIVPLLGLGCTTVRSIDTGPGQPPSYYIECHSDMGNCLDKARELCPSGYNVTSTSADDNIRSAVIVCRKNEVPAH